MVRLGKDLAAGKSPLQVQLTLQSPQQDHAPRTQLEDFRSSQMEL